MGPCSHIFVLASRSLGALPAELKGKGGSVNTAVTFHDRRLLALVEAGPAPFHVHVNSHGQIEDGGEYDYGRTPLCSHPVDELKFVTDVNHKFFSFKRKRHALESSLSVCLCVDVFVSCKMPCSPLCLCVCLLRDALQRHTHGHADTRVSFLREALQTCVCLFVCV